METAFQHLRKLEEETRKAEAQRREQDRLEAAKRKEMQRITNVMDFYYFLSMSEWNVDFHIFCIHFRSDDKKNNRDDELRKSS